MCTSDFRIHSELSLDGELLTGGGVCAERGLMWDDLFADQDWRQVLLDNGMSCFSPPGDGHCQFRVLAWLLWGTEGPEGGTEMRLFLAECLEQEAYYYVEKSPAILWLRKCWSSYGVMGASL